MYKVFMIGFLVVAMTSVFAEEGITQEQGLETNLRTSVIAVSTSDDANDAMSKDNEITDRGKKNSKNIVKLNLYPIPPLLGYYPLRPVYERVLSDHWSISLLPELIIPLGTPLIGNVGYRAGGGFEVLVKYYFGKKSVERLAANGWYVGAHVNAGGGIVHDYDSKKDIGVFAISTGPEAGYQWIFKKGFVLDAVVGAEAVFAFSDAGNSILPSPKAIVGMGYAF